MRNFPATRLGMSLVLALAGALSAGPAAADSMCAKPDQVQQVRDFYRDNPGAMPAIAAARLQLPEAVIVSSLPAAQAASAPGERFAEIWSAMTSWKEATFLIMKGANVFEIKSGIAPSARSKTSAYTNIEYKHPLRGHLRPDLYESIYAVVLPGKKDAVARGVLFYDAEGASVFGAFISGDGPPPPASELAKFDELMTLVRSMPAVCTST